MLRKRVLIVGVLTVLAGCQSVQQAINQQVNRVWHPCDALILSAPSWSPDGSLIAITMSTPNGFGDVVMVDSDTGRVTPLTQQPSEMANPVWSPDGAQILFASEQGYYAFQLFAVNVDSSQLEPLTDARSLRAPEYNWSPDVQKVVLAESGPGDPSTDIWLLNRDGSVIWRLSELHPEVTFVGLPDWSPDGQYIVFEGYASQDQGTLMVIEADGSTLQELARVDGGIRTIEWSPDGSWIAYQTWETDTRAGALHLIRPNGSEDHILADQVKQFAWFPAGDAIVYLTETAEILRISLPEETIVALGSISAGAFYETFSPDGAQIAYLDRGVNAEDLYVASVDGTDRHRLIDNPGNHMCYSPPF